MARPAHFSTDSVAHRRTASKSLGNALSNASAARGESSSSRYSTRQSGPAHPAVYEQRTDDDERRNFRAFSFPSPVSSPQLDNHPSTLGADLRNHNLVSSSNPDLREDTPPKVHRLSPSLPYPPYTGPTSVGGASSSAASSTRSLLRLAYSNARRYRLGELVYAGAFVLSVVLFFSALTGLGHPKSHLGAQSFGSLSPLLASQDRGEPTLVVRPIALPSTRPEEALHINEEEEQTEPAFPQYAVEQRQQQPVESARPPQQYPTREQALPAEGDRVEEPHDTRADDVIRDSPAEYAHDDEPDHVHEQHAPRPHALFDPRPHRDHLERVAAGHAHGGDAGLEQLIGDEVKGVGVEVDADDRLVVAQDDEARQDEEDVALEAETPVDAEQEQEEDEQEQIEEEAQKEEAQGGTTPGNDGGEEEQRDRLEFVDRDRAEGRALRH
jgi:hypothetical protein